MCAEKDPIQCHRAILVCQHLVPFNMEIAHILSTGQLEFHENLEDGLIPLKNPRIPAEQIRVLDRLEIPVQSQPHSGHEQENRLYEETQWRITGQAEVVELLRHRETKLLYPEFGKAIPYSYLQARAVTSIN